MEGTNPHICYLLSTLDGQRTYNGYTNNTTRRIRQHNGEISGGAKATRGRGPWHYIAWITSPEWTCANEALSLEWHIRYFTGKRERREAMWRGEVGRMASLPIVFEKAHARLPEHTYVLYVGEEWVPVMQDACSHLPFVSVSTLPHATSQGCSTNNNRGK